VTDTEAQPPAPDPSASQPTPAPIAAEPLRPVSELPEDARQAAKVPNQVRPSDVLIVGARVTGDVITLVRTVEQAFADAALAAALPFLQRAARDRVYGEINLAADKQPRSVALGMYAAARVARGGEATE